jgi:hypothetical protein
MLPLACLNAGASEATPILKIYKEPTALRDFVLAATASREKKARNADIAGEENNISATISRPSHNKTNQ